MFTIFYQINFIFSPPDWCGWHRAWTERWLPSLPDMSCRRGAPPPAPIPAAPHDSWFSWWCINLKLAYNWRQGKKYSWYFIPYKEASHIKSTTSSLQCTEINYVRINRARTSLALAINFLSFRRSVAWERMPDVVNYSLLLTTSRNSSLSTAVMNSSWLITRLESASTSKLPIGRVVTAEKSVLSGRIFCSVWRLITSIIVGGLLIQRAGHIISI